MVSRAAAGTIGYQVGHGDKSERWSSPLGSCSGPAHRLAAVAPSGRMMGSGIRP
jgi:hypothetical protein